MPNNSWLDLASPDQSTDQSPAQPAPTAPAPAADDGGGNTFSRVLHAVGDALGGPKTRNTVDANGNIVPQKLTTGQRVGTGIATAVLGMGAGMAQHGPGSVGRSIVAGSQAEQSVQDRREQQLRAQADMAIHAINTARLGWQFAREKQTVREDAIRHFNTLDSFVGSDERNQDLGTYKSFADFLTAHPELQSQGHNAAELAAQGVIVPIPLADDNGVAQSVKIWRLSPEWKDEPATKDVVLQGDDGKPRTVTAGKNSNRTLLSFLQNSGYGALSAAQVATGPKSHEEAVGHLANGSPDQQAAAQRFLDTEEKLKGSDALSKLESTPSMLAHENASAAIPQLNSMLQSETDPAKRVRITRLIHTAQAAHQGYVNDQRSEANAKQLATQGSPVDAGKMLADGSLTLADLKTRGLTPAFILQATNNAQRINPSYKPSDEVIAEQVAKSPAANQFFGSANSLIAKGGTLDQLVAIGAKIPQGKIPALNSIEDWTKLARGNGPLAGYAATLLGVADDYGKVMGGGTATDTSRNSALALVGAAQSPEQRADAVAQIRGSVVSQAKERIGTNQFLSRQYGYSLPKETQGGAQRPVPPGATPILRNGQTVGYILNGQRTNL
jgi:hypothetical protein